MGYRLTELITRALHMPTPGAFYQISNHLRELHPGKVIFETTDWDFDLKRFAEHGGCACLMLDMPQPWSTYDWGTYEKKVESRVKMGFCDVIWAGHRLQVLWVPADHCKTRSFIITETQSLAEKFFEAVCRFSTEKPDRIQVFSRGYFSTDDSLVKAIEEADLEQITMDAALRQEILRATQGFFESEDRYVQAGVAWKRGIIFHGPPGNGKTHLMKALVKHLDKPCLYVRTLESGETSIEESIGDVFTRAREQAPCILVLEDLDSLLANKRISVLLNEIDGFAKNHGILILATTNYPERLDPALANRPSRFDRKFELPLPSEALRREFLERFIGKWPEERRPSAALLDKAAKKTEGFAFVHLKEVCLDALAIQLDQPVGDPFMIALKGVRKEMTKVQAG